MDVRIVTDVTTEPVDLYLVKDFCRIDADYTGEDSTLSLLQSSARELLEGFLNLSLAPKVIEISWDGCCMPLPYGPHGTVVDVRDNDGVVIDTDNYSITGLDFKTIDGGTVNYEYFYPIGGGSPIIEPIGGFKTSGGIIKINVGYTSENLPSGLKLIILRLVDYMYQNRGSVVSSLPSDFRRDSLRYSRNSIL